jgi:hypothetical protein
VSETFVEAIVGELADGGLSVIPHAGRFTRVENPQAFRAAVVEFLL